MVLLALSASTTVAQSPAAYTNAAYYSPQYDSGYVGAALGLNAPTGVTSIVSSINIVNPPVNGFASSVNNPITVHFNGAYASYLQTMTVTLSKGNVNVTLFQLNTTNVCFGSLSVNGTQLLFSDNANIPASAYSCQTTDVPTQNYNMPVFYSGQSYAIQPSKTLAAFDNTFITGVWTLNITITANPYTVPASALASRFFNGWGLTFGAVQCPRNSFLSGSTLLNAACTPCPANSYEVNPGLNTPSSCSCLAGYTSTATGQCVACPLGTFRALSSVSQPFFQHRLGVNTCQPCYSSTIYTAANSPAACSQNCDPGYQSLAAGQACTPCPQGSYKPSVGSVCTSCPVGWTTAGPATTGNQTTSCVCDRGYDSTTVPGQCTACLPGSFKDFIGAGACISCGVNAISGPGASACTCVGQGTANPYIDYSPVANNAGAGCAPRRSFKVRAQSGATCSATCDVGKIAAVVTCEDAAGIVYNNTFCSSYPLGTTTAVPAATLNCNTQPCVANGYVPQYGSGAVNLNIPFLQSVASLDDGLILQLNLTGQAGSNTVDNSGSGLSVVVNFAWPLNSRFDYLELILSNKNKPGTSVTLLSLAAGATGACDTSGIVGTGSTAQLVFTDNAARDLTGVNCATTPLNFANGEAYSLKALASLAAFSGVPFSSVWQLTVRGGVQTGTYAGGISNNAASDVLLRRIVSWGITYNTVSCAQNTYLPSGLLAGRFTTSSGNLPTLNSQSCIACPTNSQTTPAANGVYTINSCVCNANYAPEIDSTSTVFQCTPCILGVTTGGTYRTDIVGTLGANIQSFVNNGSSAACQPCFGTSNLAGNCEPSATATCNAGYGVTNTNPAVPCTICATGTYSPVPATTNTPCAACTTPTVATTLSNFGTIYTYPFWTVPTTGAADTTSCVCAPGTTKVGTACTTCSSGYNNVGNGTCLTCAANAEPDNTYDATSGQLPFSRCKCSEGYFDYTYERHPSGSGCTPRKVLVRTGAGSCSMPCQGGVRSIVYNCTDAANINSISPLSNCTAAGLIIGSAQYPATEVCNTQVCIANAFTPQVASPLLATRLPNIQVGSAVWPPVGAVNHTITLSAAATGGISVGADGRQLVVHVGAVFATSLFDLRIALAHDGVIVPLFAGPPALTNCRNAGIQAFAQINFADYASLGPLVCSATHYPTLLSGQTYTVSPVSDSDFNVLSQDNPGQPLGFGLQAFNDLPMAGDWTIYAWQQQTFQIGGPPIDPDSRMLINWGLTFNATLCEASNYIPIPNAANGTCISCPANSLPSDAGVASGLSTCQCIAGFDARIPGNCTACPLGTFRGPIPGYNLAGQPTPLFNPLWLQSAGLVDCISCNASTATTGSASFAACNVSDCNPGYTFDSVSGRCLACSAGSFKSTRGTAACTACPVGQYQPNIAATSCLPCSANATSVLGASSCICATNYTASLSQFYNVNGSTCVPVLSYVSLAYGACSSPCEYGTQSRIVQCQDAFGNVYPTARCNGTAPVTTRVCNTDVPCTRRAYIPQYASGFLNRSIEVVALANPIPATATHTINVNASVNANVTAANPVAIHFEARYLRFIQTLKVTVCHLGVCANVLNLADSVPCLGSFGAVNDTGSSVVFSDWSALPALTCTNADLLYFQPGEAYVVPPTEALSKFNGLPMNGDWTISVYARPLQRYALSGPFPGRFFVSWGLTFNPLQCQRTQYIPGNYLLAANGAACVNCPSNSLTLSTGGTAAGLTTQVSSINSCPCAAGYDASIEGQCTACPANTYRAISPFSQASYQQRQNVSGCLACQSTSSVATPNVGGCGSDCNPGHEFRGAFGCARCPIGTFKTTKDAGLCTSCNTVLPLSTTAAVGSNNSAACACGLGMDSTTNPGRCTPCLSGSFKDFIGNGSCSNCAYNAVNVAGSGRCICAPGFTYYAPTPFTVQPNNGTGCAYTRYWSYTAWSECTSTCENAVQSRIVFCTDISGAVFADSACNPAQRPAASQKCTFQYSCTANGFVPKYSKGLNLIASANTDASNTVFTSGVTTDSLQIINSGIANLGTNNLVLIVNLAADVGSNVAISLTKGVGTGSPVSTTVFDATVIDVGVSGQFGVQGTSRYNGTTIGVNTPAPTTQLVITDLGLLGSLYASQYNTNKFAVGETYSVQPKTSFATTYNNLALDDTWSLTVSAVSGSVSVYSWGLDVNPNTCLGGTFTAPTNLVAPAYTGSVTNTVQNTVCVPCGSTSAALFPPAGTAGFLTVTSCPCRAGYDYVTPYTCTLCRSSEYDLGLRLQQGVKNCAACNSVARIDCNPATSVDKCTEECLPGFYLTASNRAAGGICSPCPEGSWKNFTGQGVQTSINNAPWSCTRCTALNSNLVSTTIPTTGATTLSSCLCPAGYNTTVNQAAGVLTCNLCPVNFFRSTVLPNPVCSPCVGNSTSFGANAPSFNCSCIAGFTDYTIGNATAYNPNGAGCIPTRNWVFTKGAAFTATCSAECDGGFLYREVVCVDSFGNTLPDSGCTSVGLTRPVSSTPCNTQSCITNGYTPLFSSGLLNRQLAQSILNTSAIQGPPELYNQNPVIVTTSTITVGSAMAAVSAANQVDMHIKIAYPGPIHSLQISLTHFNIPVTVFDLTPVPRCEGVIGDPVLSTGPIPASSPTRFADISARTTEIIFSDRASIPYPTCTDASSTPNFRPNMAYAIRPYQPLRSFYGLPANGDWTLNVNIVPSSGVTASQLAGRVLVSWGLSFNTTQCPSGTYSAPGTFLTSYGAAYGTVGSCVACAANTRSYTANGTSATSTWATCPCNGGYDAVITNNDLTVANSASCSICPAGTYKNQSHAFLSWSSTASNANCLSCNYPANLPANLVGSTGLTAPAGPNGCNRYCADGHIWNTTVGCSPAPIGTYIAYNPNTWEPTPLIATPCPGNSTTLQVGSYTAAQCFCSTGYFCPTGSVPPCSVGCAIAPNGTYVTAIPNANPSAVTGNCAANAESAPGSTSCRCKAGFVDLKAVMNLTVDISGADCALPARWVQTATGSCSASCDGGVRTLTWSCRSADNSITYVGAGGSGVAAYDPTIVCGAMPATSERCGLVSCIRDGYVGEYSSSPLFVEIPVSATPALAYNHTITIPATVTGNLSASNQIALVYTGSFGSNISNLRLALSHNGVKVDFLFINNVFVPTCSMTMKNYSQIVISDQATNAFSCAAGAAFLANQTYALRPTVGRLSAFYGLPAAGNWTLSVYSAAPHVNQDRHLWSWGLTVAPVNCEPGQYNARPSLISGCIACPPNTLPQSTGGVQSILGCTCAGGFDTRVDYRCTICPTGTYRALNASIPNIFQQSVGGAYCQPCYSAGNAPGASSALQCTSDCQSGYQWNPAVGCVACPVGQYKIACGSGSCTTCGANQTTVSTGSIAASACVCQPGFYLVNGFCQACPVGTFQNVAANVTSCTPCAANANSTVGAAKCTCNSPFVDYTTNTPAGACEAVRSYTSPVLGACTNTAQHTTTLGATATVGSTNTIFSSVCDTGYKSVSYSCSVAGNAAACTSALPAPPTFTAAPGSSCPNPSCVGLHVLNTVNNPAALVNSAVASLNQAYFVPQWGSGYIGADLQNNSVTSNLLNVPTVQTVVGTEDVISATNPLSVHVSLNYPNQLQTLNITVTHCLPITVANAVPNCVSVSLLSLPTSSVCSVSSLFHTQLVFSDNAGLDAITCSDGNLVLGQLGETYVVRPSSPLSAFFGRTFRGEWTLSVGTSPVLNNPTQADAAFGLRKLHSWGLTQNATVCGANQFLLGGTVAAPVTLVGTCVACPVNTSYPVRAGVNTANSCPALSGYSYSGAAVTSNALYTACPSGTFREVPSAIRPQWLQQTALTTQNSWITCQSCHASTVSTGTARAVDCGSDCGAGFQPIFPSFLGTVEGYFPVAKCRPCGINQFKTSTMATDALCLTCGNVIPNTVGIAGINNDQRTTSANCVCAPGYYLNNYNNSLNTWGELGVNTPVCSPCPANTYKAAASNGNIGSCLPCSANATAPAASTRPCTCSPGFADVSAAQDASLCITPRFYVATSNWTACSTACGGTGTQTRNVTCRDAAGNSYSDSDCFGAVKPVTVQACNTQQCTDFGYVPTIDSGILNVSIPVVGAWQGWANNSGHNNIVGTPYGGEANVAPLVVTLNVTRGGIVTPSTPVTVYFTAIYPAALETLRVSLFHNGVSVTVFEVDPLQQCASSGSIGAGTTGSQIVFTDSASLPAPTACSTTFPLSFQANQSTIIKPASPLSAFNYLNITGLWTLTVFAIPTTTAERSLQVFPRTLLSWGLDFVDSSCPENFYTPLMKLNKTCTACPLNSIQAYAGTNGINSCPCANGYYADFSSGSYQCVACPIGTYKYISFFNAFPYSNIVGPAGCLSCKGQTASAGTGSPAGCGVSFCDAGHGYTGTSPCTPCPLGTTNTGNSQICAACPAGTFMNITGSTVACYPCASGRATSAPGASRCTCITGASTFPNNFFDYSVNKPADGSGCAPQRSFAVASTGATCSARCETGYINQTVVCTDNPSNPAAGTNYDPATCIQSGSTPISPVKPCNTQLCNIAWGYFATYQSGSLDQAIPVPLTQLRTGAGTGPYGDATVSTQGITNTIVVPPSFFGPLPVVSSNYQPAIHFTAAYVSYLNTLKVTLTHAGVTVTLFDLGSSSCANSSIWNGPVNATGSGAQLIFADQASGLAAPTCDSVNAIQFYQGQVYIIKPKDTMAAFWGLPVTGSWTINVYSTSDPNAISNAALRTRQFISWGITFNPTVCAANQFVLPPYLNSGICRVSPSNAIGWTRAGVSPPAFCPAGNEIANQPNTGNGLPPLPYITGWTCSPCAANTYKDHVSLEKCLPCSPNSSSGVGAAACTCNAGFVDYSTTKPVNGSNCVPVRSYAVGAFGTCSRTCGVGVQTRSVTCVDASNATLPLDACIQATGAAAPFTSQVCNTQPCLSHAYAAQFDSGVFNVPIPRAPAAALTHTLFSSASGLVSSTNPVAVLFAAQYSQYLHTLNVSITHAGVTVQLFNLGSNICYGSFEAPGAQVIFTDQSSAPTLQCSQDVLVNFKSGQAYSVLPSQPLDRFYGTPAGGAWTITVIANQNAQFTEPASNLASRLFHSWGLTFAPSNCGQNMFIDGPSNFNGRFRFLTDACVACPANSAQTLQGVNTINQCPCLAGYDSTTEYACTACGLGAFRELSLMSPAAFQQIQGVRSCQNCFGSTGLNRAATSPSACLATSCLPGYYYSGPQSPCLPCPVGTIKTITGPDSCTPCGAGRTTTGRNATVCTCAPGYSGTGGSCSICPAGTYKSTADLSGCVPCDSKATSVAGAAACTCASGFNDYTGQPAGTTPSGSQCSPARRFTAPTFPACPTPATTPASGSAFACENPFVTRTVVCTDGTNNFNDSVCIAEGQVKPPVHFYCAASQTYPSCMATANSLPGGYAPQWSAGGFAPATANIPSVGIFTHTITVPSSETRVLGRDVNAAIHFTGNYGGALNTLRIEVTHAGATVVLFALSNDTCPGLLGNPTGTPAYSQLIFAEDASIPAPSCSIDNVLTFQSGFPYILEPYYSFMSAWNGYAAAGDYTIRVYARTDYAEQPPSARSIVNWGVTFNTTKCADNSFITPSASGTGLITATTCSACPTGQQSVSSTSGVNALTSCGCNKGWFLQAATAFPTTRLDYKSATCLPCPVSTYKSNTVLGVCQTCSAVPHPSFNFYRTSSFTNVTGSSFCLCSPGYVDYTGTTQVVAQSGRLCTPRRSWATGPWSNCTSACETGTQTRDVRCIDPVAGFTESPVYADSECVYGNITKPATSRLCNTQTCVAPYGYNTLFGSGVKSFDLNPASGQTGTFTDTLSADPVAFPEHLTRAGVNATATVRSAIVNFTAQYTGDVVVTVNLANIQFGTKYNNRLTIAITSASQTVTLFDVQSNGCSGAIAGTGAVNVTGAATNQVIGQQSTQSRTGVASAAQLSFTDNAQTPALSTCPTSGGDVVYQVGQSYLMKPLSGSLNAAFGALNVFNNQYQLSVTYTQGGTINTVSVPIVVSWGLSYNATNCTANTFIQPNAALPNAYSAPCTACSLNTLVTPTNSSGPASYTSCPCIAGYEYAVGATGSSAFTCVACQNAFYRENINNPADRYYQLSVGTTSSVCVACNAVGTNPSLGASTPSQCLTSQCLAGYQMNPAGVNPGTPACTPCPVGSFKATNVGSCQLCGAVVANSTNTATGQTSCSCPPGTDGSSFATGQCRACPANTYQNLYSTTQGCRACTPLVSYALPGSAACVCNAPAFSASGANPAADGSSCVPSIANPNLAYLNFSTGTFAPLFNSNNYTWYSYTLNISYADQLVNFVTAPLAPSGIVSYSLAIAATGSVVQTGVVTGGSNVTLNFQPYPINYHFILTVFVNSNQYTVTIFRGANTEARLASIAWSNAYAFGANTAPVYPPISTSDNMNYFVSLPFGVTAASFVYTQVDTLTGQSIRFNASTPSVAAASRIFVAPTVAGRIDITGLQTGQNILTIVSTASNGISTLTYTVNIYVQRPTATLVSGIRFNLDPSDVRVAANTTKFAVDVLAALANFTGQTNTSLNAVNFEFLRVSLSPLGQAWTEVYYAVTNNANNVGGSSVNNPWNVTRTISTWIQSGISAGASVVLTVNGAATFVDTTSAGASNPALNFPTAAGAAFGYGAAYLAWNVDLGVASLTQTNNGVTSNLAYSTASSTSYSASIVSNVNTVTLNFPVVDAYSVAQALVTPAGSATTTSTFLVAANNVFSISVVNPPLGVSVVEVRVTAGDGNDRNQVNVVNGVTFRSYFFRINRLANNPLLATNGLVVNNINVLTSPLNVFPATITPTPFVSANGLFTVTATAADSAATVAYRVNGGAFTNVTSGTSVQYFVPVTTNTTRPTELNVFVTSADGTAQVAYVVSLTRLNTVATLSALTVVGQTLVPTFSPAVTNYTITIPSSVQFISFTPALFDVQGSVSYNINGGNSIGLVNNTQVNVTIPAAAGTYVIIFRGVAGDGTTATNYAVNVVRLSNNNAVAGITISDLNGNALYTFTATDLQNLGVRGSYPTISGSSFDARPGVLVTPVIPANVAVSARQDRNAYASVLAGGQFSVTLQGTAGGVTQVDFRNIAQDGTVSDYTFFIKQTGYSSALNNLVSFVNPISFNGTLNYHVFINDTSIAQENVYAIPVDPTATISWTISYTPSTIGTISGTIAANAHPQLIGNGGAFPVNAGFTTTVRITVNPAIGGNTPATTYTINYVKIN